MKNILFLSVTLFCLITSTTLSAAETQFIDFNDGVDGQAVGNFYQNSNLTILNGIWTTNAGVLTGASPPLGLMAEVSGTPFQSVFNEQNAIVGIFSEPVSRVSIIASDVGFAGAQLKVYDSNSGGTLLGTATISGLGAGVDNFDTLEVSASGILRFEVFQPFSNPDQSDGMGLDNLSFDISGISPVNVPLPIWTWLILASLLVSAANVVFKKNKRE